MDMALVAALQSTAELCGTRLSEAAAEMLLSDLSCYPAPAVLQALTRCRKELKGRLTLAEIISRIDDGRPGPDEAWAMLPWDEDTTAVLTEEMMLAQGVARALWQHGDRTGARAAFRECYIRLCTEAREAGRPVSWQVSLGWDASSREAVLQEAAKLGRINRSQIQALLPSRDTDANIPKRLQEEMQTIGEWKSTRQEG